MQQPRQRGHLAWATTDRTLTIGYSGGQIKKLRQTSGTLTRTVTIGYDQCLNYLHSITDSTAGVTRIAYGSGTTASPSNEIITITTRRTRRRR